MIGVLTFLAGIVLGLFIAWVKDYHKQEIEIQYFDQEEFHENCTIHILTNSKNGNISLGWWPGTKENMPIIHTKSDEGNE